jgi:hypothetical protein
VSDANGVRRHPSKTPRLPRREQRGYAQSRHAHRLYHRFLQRRRQFGLAHFFLPRTKGYYAVRRAHLALRDATTSLPKLAQLRFLLFLTKSPDSVERVDKMSLQALHVNLWKTSEVS